MSRLIYADEAKENACKWECGGDPSCPYNESNGITHEQCEFMRAIDECRTIDAVPVVHGHWYVYETGYEDTEAKCSICGFEMLVNEPGNGLHMVGDLKHCPKCGAKMDAFAKDINVCCKSDEVTE